MQKADKLTAVQWTSLNQLSFVAETAGIVLSSHVLPLVDDVSTNG
jgi:hypothetical protein